MLLSGGDRNRTYYLIMIKLKLTEVTLIITTKGEIRQSL